MMEGRDEGVHTSESEKHVMQGRGREAVAKKETQSVS